MPDPDQNGQNLYPFSDQNGAKTIPFGAVHTFMAYIREYPPPPGPLVSHHHKLKQWDCCIFNFDILINYKWVRHSINKNSRLTPNFI